MNDINIRRALEKTLAGLSPALSTAYENMKFTPVAGTPYQRANLLRATPSDLEMSRKLVELSGILQVTLFYPIDAGTKDIEERAELVKELFKPPMSIVEGGTVVNIFRTAKIAAGYVDEERFIIPISIPWTAQVTG
nr:phage tail terminator-like protein [uncultured Undibacterium sp.]